MAFPQTILPIKTEMMLNDVWTDTSALTRGPGGTDAITVNRGYSGEQSSQSPGTCTFTLDNTDNRFNNRNPLSPYYRLLSRNTQFRTAFDTGTVSARYLDHADTTGRVYDGSTIWTADKAVLDIVGDFDLSVDVECEDWRGRRGQIFVSKYLRSGNQRSWAYTVDPDGYLYFLWTTDGTTATLIAARCPTPMNPAGRVCLRVQLDVDNGSSGWTCSFYQASVITGPYTLIGSTSGSGVTSIFSGSARVEIGTADLGSGWVAVFGNGLSDADPFVGKMYRAILRTGLAGTTVADFNPGSQANNTASWSDGLGTPNTWTVVGSTYLHSYNWRFWGEIPSLPRRADTSVTDLNVPTRAADMLQRLTIGNRAKPLESPVKRNLKQFAWDGYWPMEDDSTAPYATAYVGQNATLTSTTFSTQPPGFLGSAGALDASDDTATAVGHCAKSTGTPSQTTDLFYFEMSAAPPSATYIPIMRFYHPGGTGYVVTLLANNANYAIQIYDVYGTNLVSVASTYSALGPTNWTAMRVKLSNVSTTITWEFAWYTIGSPAPLGTSGTYTGVMGRPDSWSWPAWTGKLGSQLAHVCMGRLDPGFTSSDFTGSSNAYAGENWSDRARRLASEENIPLFLRGCLVRDGTNSFVRPMGAQGLESIAPLLAECASVAGGDLYGPRDKFGLTIASKEIEYNRATGAQLQLDYSLAHLSGGIEPEPDDFLLENDVTLTQPDGTAFRYVKTSGSLNAQDPGTDLNAVGAYPVADSAFTYALDDLQNATYRRVLKGTWDEDRYPQIQVELTRAPFSASAPLTEAVHTTDLFRPLSIVNPAAWLAVNQIDLLISGYTEIMGQVQHTFVWNTRPYGPWKTGTWGSSTFATTSLWGAGSSTLNASITSSVTSIVVTTPDQYERWDAFPGNFLIEIEGEWMTVTNAGARSGTGPYTTTLTVTRSVNGIIKAHSDLTYEINVVNTGRWA
jgi:hypothetical protein